MSTSNNTPTYLANLTPLRGIAALLTVIFHVDLMLGSGGDMLLRFQDSMLISRLYLMVDFFFVLSGFVMCHVYGTWFAEGVSRGRFRQFTVARFARVYPLHLFALLSVVVIFSVSARAGIPNSPVLQTENSLYSFITNLLLLQSMNLHQWFSWNHAAWSISTEWWMYMLFPFLVRPFLNLKPVGRLAVVLGCFLGYVAITMWLFQAVTVTPALAFMFGNGPAPANNTINVAFQFGFVRCLCGFVLGMMMYQSYRDAWGKAWLGNGYTLLLLTLGLGLCLHFAIPDVLSMCFVPLIVLSAAYSSQRIDRVFAAKPLQRLGDWSFSIYLVHQPMLFIIGSFVAYQTLGKPATGGPPPKPDMLTGWLMCLAFILLTLLVASLTYRFVEVPARKALNGRFQKPHAPASHLQIA
jgi:peptidoglycan/LPS O-acetylase OafA/YrhL